MRYRIIMSVAVEANNQRQAHEFAKKIKELLNSPEARMMMNMNGIELAEDGRPVVHQPINGQHLEYYEHSSSG